MLKISRGDLLFKGLLILLILNIFMFLTFLFFLPIRSKLLIGIWTLLVILVTAFAGAIAGTYGGQYFFSIYVQEMAKNKRHVYSLLNDLKLILDSTGRIPPSRDIIMQKTSNKDDNGECSFYETLHINFLKEPSVDIEKGVSHLKSATDEEYKIIVKGINNLIHGSNELIKKWHDLKYEMCKKISEKFIEHFKNITITSKSNIIEENAIFVKKFIHDLLTYDPKQFTSDKTIDDFSRQIKVENDNNILFHNYNIGNLKNVKKEIIKPKFIKVCKEIFEEYKPKVIELEEMRVKLNKNNKDVINDFKRLKDKIQLNERIDGKCKDCS